MRNYILIIAAMLCTLPGANANSNSPYAFEYVRSGQGDKTVIFIPGFACSGEVWNTTLPQFEHNFTCYTLTMAGFAGAPPREEPRFSEWTASIAQFIRDKHLNHTILVGHSMGGALAMAVAAENPGLVERIVVVDALPCLAAMMNPTFKPEAHPDCSAMNARLAALTNDQFYAMQKQAAASMVTDTLQQERVARWSMQSDRGTFAGMYCDFSNTDLRERIGSITCPALILLESAFSGYKPAVESQYALLHGARLEYSAKALHFIMFDDPDWYMHQLTSFIKP